MEVHLWLDRGHTGWPYTLDNLHADASSGHNVVRTVFVECHADLTLGNAVEEVLTAHVAAGRGRFRGVRYICAQDPHPPLSMGVSVSMDDEHYRDGVRKVAALGLTSEELAEP